jgi:hypothetical protein
MYISRTIPEDVLGRVRNGARDALLEPLASLGVLAEQDPECAHRPYTNELLGQIERLVCLLDGIGWSANACVPETTIDTDEDGLALCEALSEAMRIATVELKEAKPTARARVRKSVEPLSTLARVVESACLERTTSHAAVFLFRADLEVLLGEMEREHSDRTEHRKSRMSRRFAARAGCRQECADQSR